MSQPVSVSTRRQFLTRAGLLAAASALPSLPAQGQLWGRLFGQTSTPVLDGSLLAQTLHRLVYDTFGGVLAFVVPGDDCYSLAQGVVAAGPGGAPPDDFESDLDDCRLHGNVLALQRLIDTQPLLPLDFLRGLFETLAANLEQLPIELPLGTAGEAEQVRLDEALSALLERGELDTDTGCASLPPVGLSSALLSAVLLNVVATLVNPEVALTAPTPPACGSPVTPFARLGFVDKQRVFELLDLATDGDYPLLSTLLGPTILGLLSVFGSGLMTTAALVSYSEASSLDFEELDAGRISIDRSRVVGWELSNYQIHRVGGTVVYDTVHGWDVFEGYFEGRKEAGN